MKELISKMAAAIIHMLGGYVQRHVDEAAAEVEKQWNDTLAKAEAITADLRGQLTIVRSDLNNANKGRAEAINSVAELRDTLIETVKVRDKAIFDRDAHTVTIADLIKERDEAQAALEQRITYPSVTGFDIMREGKTYDLVIDAVTANGVEVTQTIRSLMKSAKSLRILESERDALKTVLFDKPA